MWFRAVQRSALCRSRRELSNAYLLAKFGFDTAENEPCQVCPNPAESCAQRRRGSPLRMVCKKAILPGVPIDEELWLCEKTFDSEARSRLHPHESEWYVSLSKGNALRQTMRSKDGQSLNENRKNKWMGTFVKLISSCCTRALRMKSTVSSFSFFGATYWEMHSENTKHRQMLGRETISRICPAGSVVPFPFF